MAEMLRGPAGIAAVGRSVPDRGCEAPSQSQAASTSRRSYRRRSANTERNFAMEAVIVLLLLLAFATYLLPTIIAVVRNHPNALAIYLINLFFGWTLVGWIGTLIWSAE
jgi:hypothetical protein